LALEIIDIAKQCGILLGEKEGPFENPSPLPWHPLRNFLKIGLM
jgi:hypothetical protein